jgi:hypothetical protein
MGSPGIYDVLRIIREDSGNSVLSGVTRHGVNRTDGGALNNFGREREKAKSVMVAEIKLSNDRPWSSSTPRKRHMLLVLVGASSWCCMSRELRNPVYPWRYFYRDVNSTWSSQPRNSTREPAS